MLNITIISYKIIVKNIILKGGSTMKKILLVIMIIFPIFYFSSYKMEEKKDILYGESVPLTKSFQQEKSQDKTIPINTLTLNSMKEFFMSLNENIGFNAYGSCGIVGIAMLLSYYDSFWDDTIIQERYDQREQLSYLSTRIVSEHGKPILRPERNAGLKQFTITFPLTVLMLLLKFDVRVKKSFMENCRMTVLHTV